MERPLAKHPNHLNWFSCPLPPVEIMNADSYVVVWGQYGIHMAHPWQDALNPLKWCDTLPLDHSKIRYWAWLSPGVNPTPQKAKKIYDILVECCGAEEINREDFVNAVSDCNYGQKTPVEEYRFQGALGFGGKVYNEIPWRVMCYQEDETPERLAMIKAANDKLRELQECALYSSNTIPTVLT